MLIHGFSLVNARLLMAFGTAFYAIIEVLFFLSFFFSQNGRMLTSSDLAQRSAKFGSASNLSEWCFLWKFGRCEVATYLSCDHFFMNIYQN